MWRLARLALFILPIPNIKAYRHVIEGQSVYSLSFTLAWFGYQFLMSLAIGDISRFYQD
jgi:hypothetical protein